MTFSPNSEKKSWHLKIFTTVKSKYKLSANYGLACLQIVCSSYIDHSNNNNCISEERLCSEVRWQRFNEQAILQVPTYKGVCVCVA